MWVRVKPNVSCVTVSLYRTRFVTNDESWRNVRIELPHSAVDRADAGVKGHTAAVGSGACLPCDSAARTRSERNSMKLRTKAWLAATAAAGMVLGGVHPAAAPRSAGPTDHSDLGVTGGAVIEHLQKNSDISTSHADEGFRSLCTPGYEEAVEYVESTLEATGAFDVERQAFEVEQQTFDTVEV